jgi:hypothetical protein
MNRRDAHQRQFCAGADSLAVRHHFFLATLVLIPKSVRSAATGKGVLTYDTAATGSIPLQPVLTKEEIELLSSLLPSPVSSDLSPLQAVQYQLLRKWFDEGEIGWAEFLLLSAGGAGSVPNPDTSYATPIVFHLVRAPSSIYILRSVSLIHLHFYLFS